ncbi:hypothetical protein OROMI_031491 [Orobanche minor]
MRFPQNYGSKPRKLRPISYIPFQIVRAKTLKTACENYSSGYLYRLAPSDDDLLQVMTSDEYPGEVFSICLDESFLTSDPADKKVIICDEKLKKIFGGRDCVGFLDIAGLINPHFLM